MKKKVGKCQWRRCYEQEKEFINLPAWMVRVEKPDIRAKD